MAEIIKDTLLDSVRQSAAAEPAYACYRLDGDWQTAPIASRTVTDDGVAQVSFYIASDTAEAATADAFRLLNADGKILAEKQDTVELSNAFGAVLYRFSFRVTRFETDTTLTQSGMAADAKATGDALATLKKQVQESGSSGGSTNGVLDKINTRYVYDEGEENLIVKKLAQDGDDPDSILAKVDNMVTTRDETLVYNKLT